MTTLAMTNFIAEQRSDEDSFLVIGDMSSDKVLFWVTYSTSFLSASLGMAKALKTGPCAILSEEGLLGGVLTPKFLLLLLRQGCYCFRYKYDKPFNLQIFKQIQLTSLVICGYVWQDVNKN